MNKWMKRIAAALVVALAASLLAVAEDPAAAPVY